MRRLATLLAWLLLAGAASADAQYATMAGTPDARDFVVREGSRLTLLGVPMRIAGADVGWLGLRHDTAGLRIPTDYEVRDVLLTVQALGGTVVRARTLGASVGCAPCLMPAVGQQNAAAFAHLDAVLAIARDLGLKLIIPLAGGPADCAAADPAEGSLCGWVRARHRTAARDFFTDPGIRGDFLAGVTALIRHESGLTGQAYADDPTILAWETCDGCGRGIAPDVLAGWSEAVARAIRAADPHHLVEGGAFAGRIDPQAPDAAGAQAWATPGIDIVGDSVGPQGPVPDIARVAEVVDKAGRASLIDRFAWEPARWPTEDALEGFLTRMARHRTLTGALVGGLQGHADAGGFLPPPPGEAALYFPGLDTPVADAGAMQARGRAIRRFAFQMAELPPPAFLLPPPPQVIAARGGALRWRGSAGATAYRIERSSDLIATGSWATLCESCAETAPWQDPHPAAGPAWYRLSGINVNGHAGEPCPPAQDQPAQNQPAHDSPAQP